MIQDALLFLAEELDKHVKAKTGTDPSSEPMVVMTNISDGSGIAIPESTIGVSLVNIEEEKTFKEQKTKFLNSAGRYELKNPELKLNLYVLICSNHMDANTGVKYKENYYEGLKRLSHVIGFFQAKNVFTIENSPDLAKIYDDKHPSAPDELSLNESGSQLEKLVVELYSYSFEQMYNFWSVLGGNYLPSVLYKVRLLTIQESVPEGDETPITQIALGSNHR